MFVLLVVGWGKVLRRCFVCRVGTRYFNEKYLATETTIKVFRVLINAYNSALFSRQVVQVAGTRTSFGCGFLGISSVGMIGATPLLEDHVPREGAQNGSLKQITPCTLLTSDFLTFQ